MENKILQNQKSDIAIEYAAAFRWAYHKSKQWKSWLWSLTFLLATLQIIATAKPDYLLNCFPENIEIWIVAILLLTLFFSTIGRSFKIDSWKLIGNTAQQAHDYTILNLGVKPGFLILNPSKLKRYAEKHKNKNPEDIENLHTWWPENIEGLPQSIAVSICQLSTLKWESELRKKYKNVLWFFCMTIGLLLTILSQALMYIPHQIIFNIITPATPFIALLIDEIITNHRCYKIASDASKTSDRLWNDIMQKSKTDDELKDSLESIQHDWQQYRKDSTQIFDWLYWLTRKAMEKDMVVDAEALVKDYKTHLV